MSKADTWMPLYIGDYLADTMHLEAREHGAYLLLLMHYWRNGPLPDDDRALAGIARVDRKTWSSDTGPIVRAFFAVHDGKLYQKRVDAERAEADENSAKKRDAANRRWSASKKQKPSDDDASGGAGGDATAHADAYADAYADASGVHVQTTCPYAGVPPSPSPRKKDSVPDGTDDEPSSRPPSSRDLVWSQGVPILVALTGKSPPSCRSLLGKMLRDLRDDCPRLLLVLQQAQEARPVEPLAWLAAATKPKDRKASRDERILRAAGLWDDGPILEHIEPMGLLQ